MRGRVESPIPHSSYKNFLVFPCASGLRILLGAPFEEGFRERLW